MYQNIQRGPFDALRLLRAGPEGLLFHGALRDRTLKQCFYTPKAFCISPAMAAVIESIFASDSASTITLASASVPE